jgi:thioredoxin-dependent peroxiredoxin
MNAPQTDRLKLQIQTGEFGGVKKTHPITNARPGDRLPSIDLRSTRGNTVQLAQEAQSGHLVLFFYPGDLEGLRYPEMSGCTPEACSFRDSVADLRKLGAEVFGINFHSTSRQKSFVAREHLNFPLLSDDAEQLTAALEIPVWTTEHGERFVTRTTVIVKKGGIIAKIFDDVQPDGHVAAVLAAVEKLCAEGI